MTKQFCNVNTKIITMQCSSNSWLHTGTSPWMGFDSPGILCYKLIYRDRISGALDVGCVYTYSLCRLSYIFWRAWAAAGATHDDTKDFASFWRVPSSLLVAMSFVGCSFGKVVSLRFARVQSMQIKKRWHWEHPPSGKSVWTLLGAGHRHGWYQWYPTANRNDASCFRSEPPMVFAWQHGHDWNASKVVVATCCRTIHSTTCCFVAKVSRKSCNIKISWNGRHWPESHSISAMDQTSKSGSASSSVSHVVVDTLPQQVIV